MSELNTQDKAFAERLMVEIQAYKNRDALGVQLTANETVVGTSREWYRKLLDSALKGFRLQVERDELREKHWALTEFLTGMSLRAKREGLAEAAEKIDAFLAKQALAKGNDNGES